MSSNSYNLSDNDDDPNESFSSILSYGSMSSDESSTTTFFLVPLLLHPFSEDSLEDSNDSDDDSSMASEDSDDSILHLCLVTMRFSEHALKFHCCWLEWGNHALILHHENQFDSKYQSNVL